MIFAFIFAATFLMTLSASYFCFETTTGTPSFIIPAFSFAIDFKLYPKICWWSNETGVIAVSRGLTTLVESSLPPSPTSIIAISIF